MGRSCAFYSNLGLKATFGGPDAKFTTFSVSAPVTEASNVLHVNLVHAPAYVPPAAQPGAPGGWGRAVFFVDDVDALHSHLINGGVQAPAPRDAPWGERYFHVLDPDGHELSFATPDYTHPRWKPEVEAQEVALGEALHELKQETGEQARAQASSRRKRRPILHFPRAFVASPPKWIRQRKQGEQSLSMPRLSGHSVRIDRNITRS